MWQPEIFVCPFRITRIEGWVMRSAGGAEPRVKGLGVLVIGNRRVEVGAAAEPAPSRGQEAGVHVRGRNVRIGHVRDEADAGGEEARILFRAGNAFSELGAEL